MANTVAIPSPTHEWVSTAFGRIRLTGHPGGLPAITGWLLDVGEPVSVHAPGAGSIPVAVETERAGAVAGEARQEEGESDVGFFRRWVAESSRLIPDIAKDGRVKTIAMQQVEAGYLNQVLDVYRAMAGGAISVAVATERIHALSSIEVAA